MTIGQVKLPPNAPPELVAMVQEHQRTLAGMTTLEQQNTKPQPETKIVSVHATRAQVANAKKEKTLSAIKKIKAPQPAQKSSKKAHTNTKTKRKADVPPIPKEVRETQLLNNPHVVLIQSVDSTVEYSIREADQE